MKRKHQRTLELIHARPVSANVRWGDIEALFRELWQSSGVRALGSGLSFAHEWSPNACAFSATVVIRRGCLGIPYAGGGTRFARTVIACGRNAPHIPGYGGGAGRPPGYRVRRRGQLFFVSVVTPVGAHPAQLCREPIRR